MENMSILCLCLVYRSSRSFRTLGLYHTTIEIHKILWNGRVRQSKDKTVKINRKSSWKSYVFVLQLEVCLCCNSQWSCSATFIIPSVGKYARKSQSLSRIQRSLFKKEDRSSNKTGKRTHACKSRIFSKQTFIDERF